MHMYIYASIYVYTYLYTHIYSHIHTHTHTHTHTRTHTHTHTHTHTQESFRHYRRHCHVWLRPPPPLPPLPLPLPPATSKALQVNISQKSARESFCIVNLVVTWVLRILAPTELVTLTNPVIARSKTERCITTRTATHCNTLQHIQRWWRWRIKSSPGLKPTANWSWSMYCPTSRVQVKFSKFSSPQCWLCEMTLELTFQNVHSRPHSAACMLNWLYRICI